jgi:hypothetical protein
MRRENLFEIIPKKYRGTVRRAFKGTASVVALEEDLTVFRHWGGKASETGSPWYSLTHYNRPGNAQRYLALPHGNTAASVTVFKIPKGTTILRGKASSMANLPGFGENAVGGGEQVYLPDPSKAIKVEQLL